MTSWRYRTARATIVAILAVVVVAAIVAPDAPWYARLLVPVAVAGLGLDMLGMSRDRWVRLNAIARRTPVGHE